ncbi:hypothetical protein QBC33DRAFT_510361 [Phialemonium atrogriseum]|uniref:Myb-like DNA-binding domain-containing protein n=1 Tax=Phialemonium atrogriseum TaxID=1093897 RepID=A0AAJ0CC44_9PEZI|nr:uncharacterized protein QBC33DRAFT_510361 [Phialemonium atrogriseum]KAK1772504.1 hypothetical protein QBC33DRAFT_510361 [Phialemonium atrogriseum]
MPLDTESQFKFLVSCIKHSTAGKVDFVAVANELQIVSKAAAAKRYERLLKAHGVAPGGGNRANTAGPKSAGTSPAPKRAAAKKRKMASADSDDDEDVKPEDLSFKIETEAKKPAKATAKTTAKKESKAKKEKIEVEVYHDGSSILNTIPEAPPQVGESGGEDDPCLLCTTEQANGYASAFDNGGASKLSNSIAGIHSFDYAANMNFHPQTMMTASEDHKPDFTGSAWLPTPEPHHFYWGMVHHESSDNGHQP